MSKLWRARAMTGSIAGEHSWVYIWDKETKHDHFSGSLAMRAVRRGHLLYHPSPWYEARYLHGIALWIMSSCTLATSAIIIVVSLVSPQAIHPNWLDSHLSPPHYSSLRN